MLSAFALALGQLTDPRVLRVLGKSLVVTLVLFALLGSAGWYGLDALFDRYPAMRDSSDLVALLIVVVASWLLWRIVALLVLQLFADEVVVAVEAKHYPAAAASARKLGLHEELANGLKGAGRALVFWLVNAVLLGRELQDMVWLRHRPSPNSPTPISKLERLLLGGAVTALLAIPFVNLLAPLLGAAAATHLIHRKGDVPHVS